MCLGLLSERSCVKPLNHIVKSPAAAKPPSARPLRVVIMEAGAGGNVTTVRRTSESVLEDLHKHGAHATLVRINPDRNPHPSCSAGKDTHPG